MNNTGQRFKEIRQHLALSQQEFGSKLGLTSQGISNIEKNKSFLTLEKLQALKFFNINLNYLIYGEGEMFITTLIHSTQSNHPDMEKVMLQLLKKNGII